MNRGSVAKRYAEALFEVAQEKNLVEQTVEELSLVEEVFNLNPDLIGFLSNPKVSSEVKKSIVSEIVSSTSPIVSNLIYLLVDRRRHEIIGELVEAFREINDEKLGIAQAIAYTPQPLTREDEAHLSEVFARKIGKKSIYIKSVVDPSILGGVKLQIGNVIYDGTLVSSLDKLNRHLITNRM